MIYFYSETQKNFCEKIKLILKEKFGSRKVYACVKTYGCQQNVSDSEKYIGMLEQMGFSISDNYDNCDLILFNTCAIRENAENKVFGNIGRVKYLKKINPNLKIVLCGCMTEQEIITNKINSNYNFVDMVIGTNLIHKFPELLFDIYNKKDKVKIMKSQEDNLYEEFPCVRNNKIKAFISIMSGCNNFCSYCIVPYVRGRERSREPECIIKEFENLLNLGYKDITLVGQNVNSYGQDLNSNINFPKLLKSLDNFDKEYNIRFMTSHPKDATEELFEVMKNSKHICKHIHLPVQSGNNNILNKMNRKYTREIYLEKIKIARNLMPDIKFTSDIIVGFPGETYEEFCDTLDLIKQVEYSSLFTFIYSPRAKTPAAQLPDNISKQEKTEWLLELLKVQETISKKLSQSIVNSYQRVLVEDFIENKYLMCRTDSNTIVKVISDKNYTGNFIDIKITDYNNQSLIGVIK